MPPSYLLVSTNTRRLLAPMALCALTLFAPGCRPSQTPSGTAPYELGTENQSDDKLLDSAQAAMQRGRARSGELLLRRAIELQPELTKPREMLIHLFAMQRRRCPLLQQLQELSRIRPLTLSE